MNTCSYLKAKILHRIKFFTIKLVENSYNGDIVKLVNLNKTEQHFLILLFLILHNGFDYDRNNT